MKRIEQLQKLSREHHGSLVMAKKLIEVAEQGDKEALVKAIDTLKTYNEDELEVHFQHEERTIFSVIFNHYPEHIELATTLLKEHGLMRRMIPMITPETAKKDLADFGLILKNHTRVEERELFPIIETLFTDEELDAILSFVPLD